MEHMQRMWLASRERLPFRTPGPVPHLGLANAPIVETKFLQLAMSLLDFSPRIPLGTFSILLHKCGISSCERCNIRNICHFDEPKKRGNLRVDPPGLDLNSSNLLQQGYLMQRLKPSLRKFYGRYGNLIQQYGVSFSRILNDILNLDQLQWHPNFMILMPSLIFTELRVVSDEQHHKGHIKTILNLQINTVLLQKQGIG